MDVLANPSVQRWLLVVLAVAAGAGALLFLGVLWTARRPMPAQARVFRRRVGAVGLFVVVAAGAALAVLSTPVETGTDAPSVAVGGGEAGADVPDVATARRFSSAKLPALSLDASAGWTLALDEKSRSSPRPAARGGCRSAARS